jgi:hypothetical protein
MRLITGLFRLFFRLMLLPFKLLFATLGITFRTGYRVGTAPVRVGWRATRAAGIAGVMCFVLGLAAGLLFAPGSGRELRQKAKRLLAGGGPLSDDELAQKVGFELGHAPRTWHLPQPEVQVSAGRVRLTGTVPHETARDELLRVAESVQGVNGVEDDLAVEAATEAAAE